MDDVSLEQIERMLEAKLRPIQEQLDELSRKLNQRPEWSAAAAEEARQRHPKRLAALLVTTVVAVAAVVFAGRMVLGGTGSSTRPGSGPAAGQPIYADDFSNPANGVFLDAQRGTATLPADRATAQWDYGYSGGALVAHVSPPSLPLNGRVIGGEARAANRLSGDFAFEVKAQATKAAGQAVYGLRFFPGSRDFGFGVWPGQKSYQLWEIFQPALLAARSSAIAAGNGQNTLRMEVRAGAVRLFINGQPVDDRQDDAFAVRPASVGLFFDTIAAPGDETVEIRYTEFKVYSLG
jgi:hypothetical protein